MDLKNKNWFSIIRKFRLVISGCLLLFGGATYFIASHAPFNDEKIAACMNSDAYEAEKIYIDDFVSMDVSKKENLIRLTSEKQNARRVSALCIKNGAPSYANSTSMKNYIDHMPKVVAKSFDKVQAVIDAQKDKIAEQTNKIRSIWGANTK